MQEEHIKRAFAQASYQAQPGLAQNILRRINSHERRLARARLTGFSALGLASLIAFIPAVKNLLQNFANSGFSDYLSVAFSGGATYWKELSYSLAESLPAASLAFSLFFVFVFIFSLKSGIKQIIKGQLILAN